MTEALTFDQARAVIFEQLRRLPRERPIEETPIERVAGRVLARPIVADRDYPPFPRSARDGYAVRARDAAAPPARLRVLGETRAGESSRFTVGSGETVEIMTGAPAPKGADAVVMVEHSRREGDFVTLEKPIEEGRNIVPQGSELAAGATALEAGCPLEYPQIALLASVGATRVAVFKKPTVAILSTGDEVLPLDRTPQSFQIRNSNAYSLAAQVARRGGVPQILPVAPDNLDATRRLIGQGLKADLLLLSGGVSMGKHDLVETALEEFGAEFFFTKVLIQPGKPLVFARVGDTPVFGLPGNPISTIVTFEVFARIALDLLAGKAASSLPFVQVPLAVDFQHKPVLTRFLPARLHGDYSGATVEPIKWQGSGDLGAVSRSNCFLVASAAREAWEPGELIHVLPH